MAVLTDSGNAPVVRLRMSSFRMASAILQRGQDIEANALSGRHDKIRLTNRTHLDQRLRPHVANARAVRTAQESSLPIFVTARVSSCAGAGEPSAA